MKPGDRIEVYEFTYHDIDTDRIKTGFQSVGRQVSKGHEMLDVNGRTVGCWSDEVLCIGCLIIKTVK